MSSQPFARSEQSAVRQPSLRAIVFDLDGTLVDSFGVMREAFELAYAEVVGDGAAPFDEFRTHMGRFLPDILRDMGLPPELEDPFVRESYRLADQATVYDGVRETLGGLRDRGIRMAVATGKSGERARSLLDVLGLLPLFEQVVGSDEVRRPKPAPDIVCTALNRLNVPSSSAAMIGDATADLRSGRAASVVTAAALWGEGNESELLAEGPDFVFRRPQDVLQLCPTGDRRRRFTVVR